MQKWEKYLLIILFILAILGGLIGFILTKSGIGDLEIFNNIDIFNFLELFLLALANVCAIFDIYETYEGRNELGSVKFSITLTNRNKLRYVLICLIFINIFEFGMFLYSPDAYIPPLLCMTMLLTFIIAFHNKAANVIGENGVLHWGIYHNWDDIESYSIENNTLLEVNLINAFFGFEYIHVIKFNFDENDKEELSNFLESNLQVSIYDKVIDIKNVKITSSDENNKFLYDFEQPENLTNSPSPYSESPASENQCDDSPNNCDQFIGNVEQLFHNINQYEKLLRNIDQCKELVL